MLDNDHDYDNDNELPRDFCTAPLVIASGAMGTLTRDCISGCRPMSDSVEPAAQASPMSTDLEVLGSALHWLQSGIRVALVTVLRTWGSSPRPPGALLAINADGALAGSVSGGCVEQALVERWRAGEWDGRLPLRIDFGVSSDDALRVGLPCGGRLELLVEDLASAAALRALIERLAAASWSPAASAWPPARSACTMASAARNWRSTTPP
jgi:hypothetical protein